MTLFVLLYIIAGALLPVIKEDIGEYFIHSDLGKRCLNEAVPDFLIFSPGAYPKRNQKPARDTIQSISDELKARNATVICTADGSATSALEEKVPNFIMLIVCRDTSQMNPNRKAVDVKFAKTLSDRMQNSVGKDSEKIIIDPIVYLCEDDPVVQSSKEHCFLCPTISPRGADRPRVEHVKHPAVT